MQCEQTYMVSWYQKQCEREAKYKVTRQSFYLGGKVELISQNLCQYCARPHIIHRNKIDNGTLWTASWVDKNYPKIEKLSKEHKKIEIGVQK